MLEHPSLSIDPPGGPARAVRDPASGEQLGHLRRFRRSWFAPSADVICEGADESLLAVVGRPTWFAPVYVCDAENHPVAVVRGPHLTSLSGSPIVWCDGRSFRGPRGEELAFWEVYKGTVTL